MRRQSLVVLGHQIAQEWANARPRHNDLWSVPVFGDVTLTAILTGFTMGYSRPRASGGIIAGLWHLSVNWAAMLAAVGFGQSSILANHLRLLKEALFLYPSVGLTVRIRQKEATRHDIRTQIQSHTLPYPSV